MADCPICGRSVIAGGPNEPRTKPFCSVRCANVDLGRWLGGAYRIPVRPEETDEAHGDDAGPQHDA